MSEKVTPQPLPAQVNHQLRRFFPLEMSSLEVQSTKQFVAGLERMIHGFRIPDPTSRGKIWSAWTSWVFGLFTRNLRKDTFFQTSRMLVSLDNKKSAGCI